MIEFYKFVPQFGMRDASPFCLKLMTYLRLADIPHNTHEILDPRKAPKQKLPFIVDKGVEIGDSELIISHLKNEHGDTLNRDLSPEQRATSHAYSVMLAERFYWYLTYNRWIEKQHQPIIRDAWFGSIPRPLRGLIAGKVLKDVEKAAFAHGFGRHNHDDTVALAISDVDSIESYLGDKPFFFDDKPREIDATLYAFLSNATCQVFPSQVNDRIRSSKPLMDYINRVDEAAYGGRQ